jgi:NAD(P)-dependent dehydrogenase (short-subunit alcohol dehydrogenase family)
LPILATSRTDPEGAKARLLKDIVLPSEKETHNLSSRLTVLPLDVTDESTIEAASKQAASLFPPELHHLHLAFALPGILHAEKSPRQVDYADALETYRVNTLGPLMLMKWFSDFLPRKRTDFSLVFESASQTQGTTLPKHATWVNMSARVGSVTDNRAGGWYSYRSSKAAVNSLTKSLDRQLSVRSGDKAMAVSYHPGTVRTDLSREFWDSVAKDKLFEPELAANKMANVITGLHADQRGHCWDWKGEEVPP